MERGGVDERKSWNRIEDSAGAIEPQDETLLLASPHLCPPPTHTICKPRFRENHFLSLICSHSGPRSSRLWTPSVYQLPSLSRLLSEKHRQNRALARRGLWARPASQSTAEPASEWGGSGVLDPKRKARQLSLFLLPGGFEGSRGP